MISATRFESCAHAASLAATRSLVTPASAETTTIGSRCLRSETISIAFATRSASPTDVPPNLMTIMDELSQQSPRLQELRVQNRGSGGAANRVVHERDHAQVENRARA